MCIVWKENDDDDWAAEGREHGTCFKIYYFVGSMPKITLSLA